MLTSLSFQSLVGIFSLITPAPRSLSSGANTSNMVTSYLHLFLLNLGFGMVLKMFVFYHANFQVYPFGLLPGFLPFYILSLLPTYHILLLLILWLSLTFSFPPPPLGIPFVFFFFTHPLSLKFGKLFFSHFMIRFFGPPLPMTLSLLNLPTT
jgi:hypothetical protein